MVKGSENGQQGNKWRMRAPFLVIHMLFSKNEFERALVALTLGTKNPREKKDRLRW
jgi:hypothetical protein